MFSRVLQDGKIVNFHHVMLHAVCDTDGPSLLALTLSHVYWHVPCNNDRPFSRSLCTYILSKTGTETSFKRVYLHAINDRDGPSCAKTTEFLTSFGLDFLGTQGPVEIRPLSPPRTVVTSTFCPLTRYINSYQHFNVLIFGESHHDCETEMKHNATMGSTELVTGPYLPHRNITALCFRYM
jgi:hypothetical protein